MKIKKKRILRVILSMLLIVSFLAQSVTSLAVPQPNTEDQGNGNDKYSTTKGTGAFMFNSRAGWIMSVQEVDSVANDTAYSNCAVAVVSKYLYDYPTEYVYDYYTNPEKFTYVEWTNNKNNHTSGGITITKARRPISSTGTLNSGKSFANSYSSNAAAGTGTDHARASYFESTLKPNFISAAQLLDSDSSIKQCLEDRTLTGSYAIAVANNSGNLDAAIKAYVALWSLSGSADDAINEFIYGSESEDLDHYDVLVRYLDFLIIINAMCNNAYDSYIDDFCSLQNDNYASKFVTVTIASAIAINANKSNYYCVITLPNYYAARTGGSTGVEQLLHWDGTGSWTDLQNFYKTNAPNKNTGNTFSNDTNADRYWWSTSSDDWGMALTAFPEDLDGNTTGNAGYTYISTQYVDTPTPTEVDNPTDPSLELEFYISVSSDDYMLTKDQTLVDATVTIDFKQSEENLRHATEAA